MLEIFLDLEKKNLTTHKHLYKSFSEFFLISLTISCLLERHKCLRLFSFWQIEQHLYDFNVAFKIEQWGSKVGLFLILVLIFTAHFFQ